MNYTVLIVDAHSETRLHTRALIAQLRPSWHFLEAGSDEEAIDHSIRERIDLVSIHQDQQPNLARKLHALLPRSTLIQWCDTPAVIQTSSITQLHYAATPINEAAITQWLPFTEPAPHH